MRMLASLLLTAAVLVSANPVEVCNAHFVSYAKSDPTARYLSLDHVPRQHATKWHNAIKFAVPSASRATNLDHQIPLRLQGTISYYIDLDHLKWSYVDLNKVLEKYPYGYNDPSAPLLIIRGDWLLHQLADPRRSDAYYRLLYGGEKIPQTDKDFLEFWGVSDDNGQQIGQRFGWIEGDSQVNKGGGRLAERFNARGLSLWRTKDSKRVTTETDPLESLTKEFKHDGRELIAQTAKVSPKQGIRAAAQVYLLADANGKVVNEAPVDLVEDFNRTFGQAAIVTNASCVTCHTEGMKYPASNSLERILAAGVDLQAYSKAQQEVIEEFYLSDVHDQIKQDNGKYAPFVRACNGLTPEKNAANYKAVLDLYRAPLKREDAARELGCDEHELSLALGYASANKIVVGNRLAALAHDVPIPRDQWEEDFLKAKELVNVYRGQAVLK